jgi:hypothetical protein
MVYHLFLFLFDSIQMLLAVWGGGENIHNAVRKGYQKISMQRRWEGGRVILQKIIVTLGCEMNDENLKYTPYAPSAHMHWTLST